MKTIIIIGLVMILVLSFSGLIMASDNVAEVEQFVNNSEIYIYQTGSQNEGYITQKSYQYVQGNDPNNKPMYAELSQTGSNNTADIFQYMDGEKMSAWVTQNGSNNVADVEQFNQWGWDAIVEITQLGDDNMATVDQVQGNFAYITQEGNDNESTIVQDGYSRNTASIFQYGHNNLAEILMDNVYDSIATITQTGDNGVTNITQTN